MKHTSYITDGFFCHSNGASSAAGFSYFEAYGYSNYARANLKECEDAFRKSFCVSMMSNLLQR
mgnify:CR=1 FL=1